MEDLERWRLQKTIKDLQSFRGNGTSMISLILSGNDQIHLVNKMLTDETNAASNIKSRVNRQSVISAITSTIQKLKQYTRTPENGLAIFCGEHDESKKMLVDIVPFRPLTTSLYLCDSMFHTAPLENLLEDNEKFGFIIMDGSGALFGTLCGSYKEVITKISVDLPKKMNKGGQSALRFARLRTEKRHNYIRKVSEICKQIFLPDNEKPNVKGIVLAGFADFKNELAISDLLDPRLKSIIIKIFDIQYGEEVGFTEAIKLAGPVLQNVQIIEEQKVLQAFFEEIAKDTGKYCYGFENTKNALEEGLVKTLIMWENLDIEWGSKFSTELKIISDRSEEGSQFVKGFGGIGGILRYKIEIDDNLNNEEENFDESEFI